MAKKYIKTVELAQLTGRPYNEILSLVNTGVLPGYKTHRGRWLINIDAVEKYFDIQIDIPTERQEKSKSAEKPTKDSMRDNDEKLICGHTARKYLKCSKAEFESLVEQGVIQAHRDEYMRWKVSKKSVLDYAKRLQLTSGTRLITNENHYREIVERICAAESSIRMMTANFKRFRLKPTNSQGQDYNDGTPFVKAIMDKALEGVHVQVVCLRPSPTFQEEWREYYRQLNPELFEWKFCERNHAKAVIVDDRLAYVGSANVTPAGLGQGIFTPGNFEAGILTENPEIVSSVKALFSMIWDGGCCTDCHRAGQCSAHDDED